MSKEAIAVVLAKYLPPSTVEICTAWIIQKNIHLKITRGRSSKYGDYLPLGAGRGHRISVNHDLNPYSFLITFVHEVAHLHCHENYRYRHEPHGKEWKHEFRLLLNDFLAQKIFPAEIEHALARYIHNPAASNCSDFGLSRALKKHDLSKEGTVFHLEELAPGSEFRLHQSRSALSFRKGKRLRTRFQCLELNSNRVYFVSALAEVIPCASI